VEKSVQALVLLSYYLGSSGIKHLIIKYAYVYFFYNIILPRY